MEYLDQEKQYATLEDKYNELKEAYKKEILLRNTQENMNERTCRLKIEKRHIRFEEVWMDL